MTHLALVVEDDEEQAFVFTEALQNAGYEAEVFNDGEQAQRRLNEITPNLVVLDLHMPVVSGPTILAQIREDERFVNTHVFLASADARLAEHLRHKADLVLLKPVSYVQLHSFAERFKRKL